MKKKYYPFFIIGMLVFGILGVYYLMRRSSKLVVPYLILLFLATAVLLYLSTKKED